MDRKLYIVRYKSTDENEEETTGIKKVTSEFFANPTNGFTRSEVSLIAQMRVDDLLCPPSRGASHSIRRIA